MSHPSAEKAARAIEDLAREQHNGQLPSFEDMAEIIEREAITPQEPTDTTPKCTVSWLIAGGRQEQTCNDPAEHICADCGAGRCDDHQSDSDHALTYWRTSEGIVLCQDCITDAQEAEAEEVSTWHR